MLVSYVALYVLASPLGNASGIHWGCRLLLVAYPLLGVLAASSLSQWCTATPRKTFAVAATAAVIALSLSAQVYAERLQFTRKSFSAALNEQVAGCPEAVVAAQGWFVPQELGTVFYDKKVFLVGSEEQLRVLLTHLRRRGVREVLVVSVRPLGGAASSARRLMRDGLNFISLYLLPLTLSP